MKYETIIGLEIHAQVNSKTKFFCSCDNDSFGKEPNSNVCPICMGFPGMLPVPSDVVIEKGLRAGIALGCDINEEITFDRKQYFYPDLPTGFQITQLFQPIAENGKIIIDTENGEKEIEIVRMHLENDAGKLTHVSDGTLCDYNRAGTPLMEIVSGPDMRSAKEARLYAEQIQSIVRYVNSSDCDMEKGMMRFDASVSIRPLEGNYDKFSNFDHPKYGKLTPRAEIKNLNSFRALEAAIEYEVKRQIELWENGNPLSGEVTVGWIDDEKRTKLLRDKESAADYRYFPEPDIPPIVLESARIEKERKNLPELPFARLKRYISEYSLSREDAVFIVADKELADFFEETAKMSNNVKASSNLILSVVLKYLKENQENITDVKFSPRELADLIILKDNGDISSKIVKDVFEIMYNEGKNPKDIIEDKGWKQVSDISLIEGIIDKVIVDNSKIVDDYKGGKEKALAALVGQVMKATKGQANPMLVNKIFKQKLS